MPIQTLHEYQLGDMIVRYVHPENRPGEVGLMLLPASRVQDECRPRMTIDDPCVSRLPEPWNEISPLDTDRLVHAAVVGDARTGCFHNGRTLRHATLGEELLVTGQTVLREGGKTTIHTALESKERGIAAFHDLTHMQGDRMLRIRTTLENHSDKPLTLEMLSSFSLGGITPFATGTAPDRLWIHRFRSSWSAEARPLAQRVEDLSLEPAWLPLLVRVERFGVVGSMPANGWHPLLAVEDREAGVTWAASLGLPGSWQMELYRRGDQLSLSGGQADREIGHWLKTLAPGESFQAPEAWVSVCAAPPEKVWSRLLDGYRSEPFAPPLSEKDFPPMFNEWCTSWGSPTHDKIIAVADRLKDSGIGYLVIDDGWAERPGRAPQQNGDWNLNREAFPLGLRATTDAVRERGMIPGVWFEFEVCNPGSKAWEMTEHHLRRDGVTLQAGPRRFWDFRDPWVHEYLAEKVIAFLRDNGFGYMKVDYNDTIGLGCDGAESLGEGLRAHLEGVLKFFRRIRQELPDLVIENCSSGGNRQVASFMELTSITQFSDAHETVAIPIIAANLLPIVPPSKSQVWVVLRAVDDTRRLVYSLAAGFLGRMCLSGEVHDLHEDQWTLTQNALALYRKLSGLIAHADGQRSGQWGPSYLHPTGWQAVVWSAADQNQCVVVIHTFGKAPAVIEPIPLPPGNWRLSETFAETGNVPILQDNKIHWFHPGDFAGAVMVFES